MLLNSSLDAVCYYDSKNIIQTFKRELQVKIAGLYFVDFLKLYNNGPYKHVYIYHWSKKNLDQAFQALLAGKYEAKKNKKSAMLGPPKIFFAYISSLDAELIRFGMVKQWEKKLFVVLMVVQKEKDI